MKRSKIAFVLFILSLSIVICSASPEAVTIYVNDKDDPVLELNEDIEFSWDWYSSEECEPHGNNEPKIPILHLRWYNETSTKWERVTSYPHPDNPLLIEGGFSELGEYSVRVPWYKSQSNGCNPVIYIGSFTIEEPYEFECPGDGHGPYSGKTFATHVTILTVTEEAV